jgi:hypothetical protein
MKLSRKHKIILAVLPAIWLLTLGIHFEYGLSSSFSVPEGNAWTAFFDDETSQFYPNTWLDQCNRSTLGIPYLFHVSRDVPPFGVSFCFSARTNRPYGKMEIESLHLAYDSGEEETFTPSSGQREAEFWFDDRGIERGETPYYRANFSFPDIVEHRQPFWLTVRARCTVENNPAEYTQRIRVEPRREKYVYIGWYRLLLSGL